MSNSAGQNSLPDWQDFELRNSIQFDKGRELYSSFNEFKNIVSSLPTKEFIKRGWMKSREDLGSLSTFFIDYYRNDWKGLFRKSSNTNDILVSFWLSKCREQAEHMFISEDYPEFTQLGTGSLRDLALLSIDPFAITELPTLLRAMGVILVFLPSLPGLKLDGATFNLFSGNPVIGMSIRYSRLDYFWFTLLHELSHIVLHKELLDTPIIDDFNDNENTAVEVAANRMAKDAFVDRNVWRNCPPKYDKSEKSIRCFADKIGIHPAIVAGFLRKEEGNFQAYSNIVNSVNTREILFADD